ncbi:segregation and condensation protein B [Microbulbifer donghaiensis]|uniref:Segregation and condensation protein B n=1 Tax=Microbulbifer donghaiensis TaxID=494016 RepID=A0A1M4WXC8_9GAMM|nr:SMC-Scp complex subunit ScpB [Microbulbifer donghaiensis]SHE85858.1 segregation and condensation protein B [Microbulbifer donghaiensis]
MTIAPELLRRIVEGALLASGQPLSEDKLLSLIDEGERPEKAELKTALDQIAESCAERGFELRQVASGWRFQVPEDLAPWVNRLWEEKPQKYSRAILETLAIIAYRQPITRGDIEEIRGVAVSSHIVKTLSERGWIKVVGQRDVPGKPSLYATTKEFLDYFNLRTLDDLPTLAEIRDIDSLNQMLDLDQQGGGEVGSEQGDGAEAAPAESEAVASDANEDSGDAAAAEDSAPEEPGDDEPVEEVLAQAQNTDTESESAAADDFAEEVATEVIATADFAESEIEEVAEADIATDEIDVAAEADIADSVTEADAGVEPAEAGDAEPQTSLAAGLPPSSLFAVGDDDAADGIEETSTAEMATSNEAISDDADTDGETRKEAQVENTTL